MNHLLMIMKNAVAFITVSMNEAGVMTHFYSTILENTSIIEYSTFTAGGILLILTALYCTFKLKIKKPSILNLFQETGDIPKKFLKIISRFLTIFFTG